MAGVKISGLPAVTTAALTDTYPVVQGGLTKVESVSQLQTLFNTNLSYLSLTGGTLTGPLILSGAPTVDLQAATKLYVDLTAQGLNPKPASNAATTAALTATYANGTAGIGATLTNAGPLVALAVDGYTASVNDVILVKNQAASFQNGLYVVTAIGSGAVPWVLTRSTFMDAPIEFKGGFSFVISGATNAGRSFIEILAVTTVGTDPVTFTQQSGNFALSGANSDITSLSGLTTPLSISQGGTNATTVNAAGINLQDSGTFTPVLTPSSGAFGSITYSTQNARFLRIGKLVYFNLSIQLSAFTIGTAGGTLSITGLPYTANSAPSTNPCSTIYTSVLAGATFTQIQAFVGQSSASILFFGMNPNNTGAGVLAPGILTSSTGFFISGTFESA